ncbi:MAG: hypothetical protein AB1593_01570 [Pseudomonadota bacterium]
MNVFELLDVTKHNKQQRQGFLIFTSIITLIVLLHNPFGGYITDCELYEFNSSVRTELECFRGDTTDDIPFTRWISAAPLISWLAPTRHLLGFVGTFFVLGLLWLYSFKDKNQAEMSGTQEPDKPNSK